VQAAGRAVGGEHAAGVEIQQDHRPVVFQRQGDLRQGAGAPGAGDHHPERSGNLRHLIDYEFARSFFGPTFAIEEAYRFLRMLPYKGRPAGDKLERIQVPALIVHTINDPFASAQALANLMSYTENPNVAALIVRGGGHIGYFPYNKAYTYSLIMNFFDPQRGAAACQAGI